MTRYRRVLLDTSALVAVFQPQERYHQSCVDVLRDIATPLITSWPVLTEAHYLLRSDRNAQKNMLSLAGSDAVLVSDIDHIFFEWYDKFVFRYDDHDVQLADASLVWLAEQWTTDIVFTLDQRDFSTFKIHSGTDDKPFKILPYG